MPYLMHKSFKFLIKLFWIFYNLMSKFIANKNKKKNNDTEKTKFHQS